MNVLERFNLRMNMYHTGSRGLQGGDHSVPNSPAPPSDRTDHSTTNKRNRERARSGLGSARSQKSEIQKLKSETDQLKAQLKRLQATNVLLRKNFHRDKLDRDLVENMDLAQMLEESAVEAQMQLKMYEAGDIDEKSMSPKLRAYIGELKSDAQRLKKLLEREIKKRTHLQQAYDYLKTSRDKLEEDYRKLKKQEEDRLALPHLNDQRTINKYEGMIENLRQEIREKDLELKSHRGKLPAILGQRPHTEPDTSNLEQAIYVLKKDLATEKMRNKDLERLQHENEKLQFIIKMLREKVELEEMKMTEEKLELSMSLSDERRRLEVKEHSLRELEHRLMDRSGGEIDSSNIKLTSTPETVRLQQELARRKQEWERDKAQSALKINDLRKELSSTKHLVQTLRDELEEARKTPVPTPKPKGKGRQKTGTGNESKKVGANGELKAAKSALARKEKQLQEAGQEIAELKIKLSDAKNQQPSQQRVQSASQRIVTLQERLKEEKTLHAAAEQKVAELQARCHNAFARIGELEAQVTEDARVAKETIQRKDKSIMDLRKQIVIMEDNVTTARAEAEQMKREKDSLNLRLSRIASDAILGGNPSIVDLSDDIRPTLLAEKFSNIYDNEWTDAFEELTATNADEILTVKNLHNMIWDAYSFCEEVSRHHISTLTNTLLSVPGEQLPVVEAEITPSKKHKMAELRKMFGKDLVPSVISEYKAKRNPNVARKPQTEKFLDACLEITWYMRIQDPPVVLLETPQIGRAFQSDFYRPYTRTGKQVEYVVWPALLLHQGGPLLSKGIAQGK